MTNLKNIFYQIAFRDTVDFVENGMNREPYSMENIVRILRRQTFDLMSSNARPRPLYHGGFMKIGRSKNLSSIGRQKPYAGVKKLPSFL